jgi:hypothetical protein
VGVAWLAWPRELCLAEGNTLAPTQREKRWWGEPLMVAAKIWGKIEDTLIGEEGG